MDAHPMSSTAPPSFPFVPRLIGEPPPEFARFRAVGGLTNVVLPSGDVAWLATRYADVRQVLTDPRMSRAAATSPDAPRLGPLHPNPQSMMAMDPPSHTRLRRFLTPLFTRTRCESYRASVHNLVNRLLSNMAAAGSPGELNRGLSRPLALTVICDVIGVPESDRGDFVHQVDRALSLWPSAGSEVQQARHSLRDYLNALVAHPSSASGGLVAELADMVGGEELTEVLATVLAAGYHTVSTAITNSTLVLLRHPDQLDVLRSNPDLLPAAVEELLRYAPGPVSGGTIRVATEDLIIGTTRVHAGEAVIPATTSANRDRLIFPDGNHLDLGRRANPHIAFGAGVHHCLGMHLARIELAAAIGGLIDHFPHLRLAVAPERLVWRVDAIIGGVEELPIAWTANSG
ncbi:cytochrome P450 [Nocardia salmonicida]|uniref:cytochrome P450 n=1 Tax=Nocardia salmonicida TaxID=53431 RepID=UPI003CF25F58